MAFQKIVDLAALRIHLSDIRAKYNVPVPAQENYVKPPQEISSGGGLTAEDVEAITRAVLAKLKG